MLGFFKRMGAGVNVTVLLLLLVGTINIFAQKAVELTKEVKPATRTVSVTPASLQVYADAQKRTEEARKMVETSPVWKDLVIAQNQEQSALLYVMAENGIKPSDGCKPMTKDGNVLAQGGTLDHFECGIKEVKK